MPEVKTDIVIVGAGIAGLWTFAELRKRGYDVLLLASGGVGGTQTLAAQGIIHSGLKYALTGKVNKLAHSISAMPDVWLDSLRGEGPVDLTAARMAASSQQLLIPGGLVGSMVSGLTKRMLGRDVYEIPRGDWPVGLPDTGFNGTAIHMSEPVLDIPSVVRALAGASPDSVRSVSAKDGSSASESSAELFDTTQLDKGILVTPTATIKASCFIFTSAEGNHPIARAAKHDEHLKTQKRPLLMGFLKPAPFDLFVHLVGTSEKPIATITTHTTHAGERVWYLGGQVAERDKDAAPESVLSAIRKAFAKYLPKIDLAEFEFAVYPVDRVEGKSESKGWMPDTPTIHDAGNALYCWPTKLTFAPLLARMLLPKLEEKGVSPSNAQGDYSALTPAEFAPPPWDTVTWDRANKL